jgi:hypothetical protein
MSNDPTVPAEDLLARLHAGDRTAWRELVAHLIGVAMGHVRLALDGDTNRYPRRLVRAVNEDEQEAEAALYSALESLQRRFDSGKYPGVMSAEDLAVDLIRLAVNRCQRRSRHDARTRREVGREAMLATAETTQLSPSDDATRKEICENLATETEEIVSKLPDRDRAIIRAKLQDPHRRGCEIAREANTSDATVSRVWQLFQDELRGRLEDSN